MSETALLRSLTSLEGEKRVTVARAQVETLTVGELRLAIASLDVATRLRLEETAKWLAAGRGIDAHDLLHDAVVACLSGARKCPREVPVFVFLCNTMRSLASSALKVKRRVSTYEFVDAYEEEGLLADEKSETAEQQLLRDGQQDQIINAIYELFADDPEAQLVVAGLCQGMTRQEIQAECNLSDTAYETIRKRIRRKLNKRYPKGWQA